MTSSTSEIIASPCVRNCCLDEDDICLGCGRSLQEIIGWSASGDTVKQLIVVAAAERVRTKRSPKV